MSKKVLFRDRQEFQAKDFNDVQDFMVKNVEDVIVDAISDGYHYTGFLVVQESAVEVKVGAGRLYTKGVIYVSEQDWSFNLTSYVPLANKKIVAIVINGLVIETNVEPRDFLIDIIAGTTEPRAVAMQKLNHTQINIVPGIEAVLPQPPAIQEGLVPVAFVFLGTTGIERIVRVTEYIMPRLKEVKSDVVDLQVWRGVMEPRIANIITDLLSLSQKTEKKADWGHVLELSADMARVKEKVGLPSTYHSYDADYFGDLDKIDTDNTVAKIQNGVLFPDAGRAVANLALFNPYDPNIRRFDNLVLPKFIQVPRIKTEGYSGDVSISQYQWQSLTLRRYRICRWVCVYGWRWNWYWWWYYRWWWRYYGKGWSWSGKRGFWVKIPVERYALAQTTESINGAIVAQTFLVSSACWLTGLGLYFTTVDTVAPINVVVCETEHGKPVLDRVLSSVTVSASEVKRYPQETVINLTPVFLNPGRYAICFITQGNYRVATASGQRYLQGTLFFGTDGDYFTGDLTRDILFTLYGAQFEQARTEVQLQPVSLAGGITDLVIDAQMLVPEGSQLVYEFNVGGKWYPVTEVGKLMTAPDIVPLRAVLLGTGDVQPALILTDEAIEASRPTTAFIVMSKQRTLSAARTNIEVQLLVADFNAQVHTLTCQLIVGQNTINPSVVSSRAEDDEATRFIYSFNVSGGTTNYKIKITGDRSSGSVPFVIVERVDIAY